MSLEWGGGINREKGGGRRVGSIKGGDIMYKVGRNMQGKAGGRQRVGTRVMASPSQQNQAAIPGI